MERVTYAVLRYVPDEVKQEVFNVGVIVHIPDQRKLLLFMTDHDDTRLHYNLSDTQLYIYRKFSLQLKRHVKRVSSTLVDDVVGKSLNDDEYLRAFGQVLSYGFRIDAVHQGVTGHVEAFAQRVFSTHVTQGKTRDKDVVQLLLSKFRDLGLDERIARNPIIRGASTPIRAAFGYVNGAPHYIQPISVQRYGRENLRDGALWSAILNEIEQSEEKPIFHFVIRKNAQYDEKSLERIKVWLSEHDNAEVIDFDTQLTEFMERVKADLEPHVQ